MKFENTTYLLLLWLVPCIGAFYVYAYRKRKKLLSHFAHPGLLQKLMDPISSKKRFLKSLLIMLAFASFIIALAKPQWGYYYEEVIQRGADIIILLDTSDSMLAQDVPPNRITWAKRKVEDLLKLLEGDRIGLIAFSGGSFVFAPLTVDYETFRMLLDNVDTDVIPLEGTKIAEALETAIKSFDNKKGNSKVIILITDGEDYSENLDDMIAHAKKENITIHGIGIGKQEGSPIPIPDTGLKKDKEDKLVISKLNESSIKKIARETGGLYIPSSAADVDIKTIYYKAIKKMDTNEHASSKEKRIHDRFPLFIFFGILFLITEFFISEKKHARKTLAVFIPLFFMIFFSEPYSWAHLKNKVDAGNMLYESKKYKEALETYLNAQIDYPKNEALKNNIGNTYYRLNDYENALQSYTDLLGSLNKKVQEKAYYNAGNTLFKLQRFQEALDYYKRALELNPQDEEARYNFELTKKALEEMKKQNKEDQKNDQKNQDEQNKNEKNRDNQNKSQNSQDKKENSENKNEKKNKENDTKKEENNEDQKQENSESQEKKQPSDMKDQQQADMMNQKPRDGKIPKEQAEIILNNIKEERKKLQQRWMQKKFGNKKAEVENDW